MNLLVLDQFSDPGGAQQGLLDLLSEVRRRNWHALVGLPGGGDLFERVRELGFDAEKIDCGPYRSGRKSTRDAARFLWQIPRLAAQIRRLAGRARAALIYVNGPRLLPAVPSGVPVVFHAHSYIGPGAVRHLAGFSLRRTGAHVIANCEFVADSWRPYAPVSVIYNGVGRAGLQPATRAESPPTIACIGRIAPEKGQLEFLAAAAIIHRAIPAARFRIIGAPLFADPAAERYYWAVRAAAAGLPVEFTGWVGDAIAALSGIDLLLVPSAPHEATTRVIFEAYAAGVPVIAFRSGGIPEVVEEGVTGYLAASADEMAAQSIDLLRSHERRRRLSRAARESWQRRFTLERYRQELMQALESSAAHGRAMLRPAQELPRPPESIRIPRA